MSHLTDSELLRLVSGDLGGSAGEEAEGHARQCADCRARLKALAETWQLLGTWALPGDAPDLTERIVRAAAMQADRRRRPWRAWPATQLLAKVAASVLLAAAIGYAAGLATRPENPAKVSGSAGPAEEDDLIRTMHLSALCSPPVGLAGLVLSHATDVREMPQ